MRAVWRIGGIHAKICEDELEFFATKTQSSARSKRSEISEYPSRSPSPGCEPIAGRIWSGISFGSGAWLGALSGAADVGAETESVVTG